MISVYHKHMDLYGTTDCVEHNLRGVSTYLCQFPGKPATLYHFDELEFEMIGPEEEVIDLPESND